MTPEGKVKKAIKDLLNKHDAYYYMPVTNGMGARTLDFICCYKGLYFAIEAKAAGKHLTLKQEETKSEIEFHMGKVFVVEGTHGMQELEDWLKGV